jgi:hypothetical protein
MLCLCSGSMTLTAILTYASIPFHICINTMGPEQSAHRYALGQKKAALPCLACLRPILCCRSNTRHTMYAMSRIGSILYAVTCIGPILYGQTRIRPILYCLACILSCLACIGHMLYAMAVIGPTMYAVAHIGPMLYSQALIGPILYSLPYVGLMLYAAQYIGPMLYSQAHIGPMLYSLAYVGPMLYPRVYSISPTAIHQATVPRFQCGLLPGIMLIRDVRCRLAFGMVSHTNEEQTTYCLHQVSKHCEYVFKMYEANKCRRLDLLPREGFELI